MFRRLDFAGEPGTSTSCPPGSVSAGWKRTAARQQRAILRLYLHGMEQAIGIQQQNSHKKRERAIVRYADDFCVFCERQEDAQAAQQSLSEWLAMRGLSFSTEKTRTLHLTEGFDFLGTTIKLYKTKKTKSGTCVLIKPSKKAVHKLREKLRDHWFALNGANVEAVIETLNPIIRGWANYHRRQVASYTFKIIDAWMFHRQRRYAIRAHPDKPRHWIYHKYWARFNLDRQDHSVFGDRTTGRHLLKFTWFNIERHTLVKGNASPDDPALKTYWQKRNDKRKTDLSPSWRKIAKNQHYKCQGRCKVRKAFLR